MATNKVRQIAEEAIGRKILPGEIVHHIDHDRTNNIPENLLILPNVGAHRRQHSLDRKSKTNHDCSGFDWPKEILMERITLEIDQAELAEQLGVTQAVIGYIETEIRRPSLKMRVKLAKLLGGRFRAAVEAEDGIIVPEVER